MWIKTSICLYLLLFLHMASGLKCNSPWQELSLLEWIFSISISKRLLCPLNNIFIFRIKLKHFNVRVAFAPEQAQIERSIRALKRDCHIRTSAESRASVFFPFFVHLSLFLTNKHSKTWMMIIYECFHCRDGIASFFH